LDFPACKDCIEDHPDKMDEGSNDEHLLPSLASTSTTSTSPHDTPPS
jgi:hypothetical protein